MAIDDKTRDEKLQQNINREAGEIYALPSSKIDKYENLVGEEIQPFDKSPVIEQAKFTDFHLAKSFEKTNKNNKNEVEKQTKGIEGYGKQLAESNTFIKKSDREKYPAALLN